MWYNRKACDLIERLQSARDSKNHREENKKVSQKTLKKDLTNFLKCGIMNKSPREKRQTNASENRKERRTLHLEN